MLLSGLGIARVNKVVGITVFENDYHTLAWRKSAQIVHIGLIGKNKSVSLNIVDNTKAFFDIIHTNLTSMYIIYHK